MILRFVLQLILSIVLRYLIPYPARDRLTPWTYAYLIVFPGFIHFVSGPLYFIAMFVNMLSAAFLLDGFRGASKISKNPVALTFLIFFGYFAVAAFFGPMKMFVFMTNVKVLVLHFGVGYFAGLWVLKREGNFRRLIFACAVSATVFLLMSVLHGGLDMTMVGQQTRVGFGSLKDAESELNVNSSAMIILGMMPAVLIFVLQKQRSYQMRVFRIVVIVVALILMVMLIRSGARNAALGLLPMVLFLLRGRIGSRSLNRSSRFALIIVLTVAGVALLSKFLLDVDEIRSFDFNGGDLEEISSGRWSFWQDTIDQMSGMDRFIGAGAALDYFFLDLGDVPHIANLHSIYMNIFHQSGLIGISLLILFLIVSFMSVNRKSEYRALFRMVLLVWLLSGVGEAMNITQSGTLQFFLGLAIALVAPRFRRFYPSANQYPYLGPPAPSGIMW